MCLQTLSLVLNLFDWNTEVRRVLNVGAFLEAEASSAELTTASVWEGCGDGQPDLSLTHVLFSEILLVRTRVGFRVWLTAPGMSSSG